MLEEIQAVYEGHRLAEKHLIMPELIKKKLLEEE